MFSRILFVLACALALGGPAAAEKRPILFVLTAADHLTLKDGSKHPTGFYANELAEPYEEIRKAGYTIEIATPGGKRPTCDPKSLEARHFTGGEAELARTKLWMQALPDLAVPKDLARVKMADYAGLFVPGGHGPMEDLVDNAEVGRLLNEALALHRAIGALCHGPGALLSARDASGAWPFRGFSVTAFSDAEEPPDLRAKMIQTPESALTARGARYSKAAEKYAPHWVSDREVVTGQNPRSARQTAIAFLHALGAFHINGPNLPGH